MRHFLAMATFAAAISAFAAADVTMRPDGDVQTLDSALAKIRAYRADGTLPPGREALVEVEDGRYQVTAATVFTPEDSNVRIVARHGGRAVFDGGVRLPPFSVGADGIWRTRTPDGHAFEQLFVNGRRAMRARMPNAFYLYMREQVEDGIDPLTGRNDDMSKRAFFAEPADVAPLAALSPDELAKVELLFWQSWDMGRSRIAAIEETTGRVILRQGAKRALFRWSHTAPRYALENFRAALDAPGEWFHDAKTGEVLYIPLPGERPETTTAFIPVAPAFVTLSGDPLAGRLVRNVSLVGLSFVHSGWLLPSNGVANAQSAQNVRDAAVLGDGVEGFSMEDCRLSHIGMHGVWLKRGCRDCRLSHCLVEDLGGGGVYIGDTAGWQEDGPARVTASNRVEDCIVRSGGHLLNGAIGVWIGHACDNDIVHNDIGDFCYTGVSIGWTWGYSATVAKRNRLAWNRVHHIGQGVLSDMGGVYTLGDSAGTVVIGNWFHDVSGYAGNGSPAWGLYTDEGSRGIVMASNLVERCRDGAVHQHYGRENTFANNIFATFDKAAVWRSRAEDHTTIVVTNNIFWWTAPDAQIFRGRSVRKGGQGDFTFEGNLFWRPGGIATNAFGLRSLTEWRALGYDLASRIEDPLFRDPAHGDWRLADDSPARRMGFVPWDWTDAGVLKTDAAWRARAMDDSGIPTLKDAPAAPRYIRRRAHQNFDQYKPGTSHGHYGILKPANPKGFRVTRDAASNGNNVLSLTDSPNLPQKWHPHLTARIDASNGTMRIRWRFKTDNKAQPQFECRDYRPNNGRPYAQGPSLNFTAGRIMAGRRPIANVGTNIWCTVEVRLRFPGDSTAPVLWSCTATPSGGTPTTANDLPVSAGFRSLEWIGFMTNGTEGRWHLDDFDVEPVE